MNRHLGMKIYDRITFWEKLAQTKTIVDLSINTSKIPTFKTNLFANKTDVIQDLNKTIELFNKYIVLLSDKKMDFSATWNASSVGASQFTGGLKNIYSLSKWIYGIVSANQERYSVEDLKKIFDDLKSMVATMSFPEPNASLFKTEVETICQAALTKLGNAK